MVLKAIKIQTENPARIRAEEAKIKDRHAGTQTCAEFKAPIPVRFVPKKSGSDAETQIDDCDLFDFDTEVAPIMEVLLERTLENALLELREEAELNGLKAHKDRYHRLRQAELVEVHRLEAAEKRKQEEKSRRIQQERAQVEVARRAMSKAVSIKISRELFSGVCVSVVESLRAKGFFRDPVLIYLETSYVPNLIEEALQCKRERNRTIESICANLTHGVTV